MAAVSDYSTELDLSPLEHLFDKAKIEAAMRPAIEKAMEVARGEIARRLPDGATGDLGRAPKVRVLETANGLEGQVYIPETDKSYKYAQFVEYGRRPGKFPPWSQPTDPLYKWVKRKVSSAFFKETGKVYRGKKRNVIVRDGNTSFNLLNGKGKAVTFDPQIKGIAFLVARKIARKGTKAQHPFALGWAASRLRALTIIEMAFQRAISKR